MVLAHPRDREDDQQPLVALEDPLRIVRRASDKLQREPGRCGNEQAGMSQQVQVSRGRKTGGSPFSSCMLTVMILGSTLQPS